MNPSKITQNDNPDKALIGLAFCLLGRAEAILLARAAGFGLVLVDMEHGPLGFSELGQMAAAGRAADLPVWVRVPDVTGQMSRALDCGATGLIVPHVDSLEEARQIVRACRFAPLGARSLPGPVPALDFTSPGADALCEGLETGLTLAPMIESAAGLDCCEDIAALPGIDMLVVGTNDLADGLGLRGQLDHPALLDAFKRVAKAAHGAGKTWGVMGLPPRLLKSHAHALGAALIVATNDTNLLAEGGRALLANIAD